MSDLTQINSILVWHRVSTVMMQDLATQTAVFHSQIAMLITSLIDHIAMHCHTWH